MAMSKRALTVDSDGDRRELPAYGVTEAARYLRMPSATLRSWVLGRLYPTSKGRGVFRPVIRLPRSSWPALSFVNLVEAHVLEAIRREHEIPLGKVRAAIALLERTFGSPHPLADHQFETDGLDLFIHKAGLLINLTQDGQVAIRQIVHAYLKRVERDEHGMPVRLYPFTRKRELEEPRVVVIDPLISFGRPVLLGTGIATAVVAERFKAGETVEDLAKDYARSALEIQEAIRCELPLEAA